MDLSSSLNNFTTYPFVITRYYASSSLTINANGFKFVSISDCKTSGMEPDKDDYILSAKNNYNDINSCVVGFGCGESDGVPHKLAMASVARTGFRLFNYSSSTIKTVSKLELNSDNSVKNRPPYIDILYIRNDMFLY